MSKKIVKNQIAFIEVCKNNGYSVSKTGGCIKVKSKEDKLAFVDCELGNKSEIMISVYNKKITINEAMKLKQDLERVIDFAKYIIESMDI